MKFGWGIKLLVFTCPRRTAPLKTAGVVLASANASAPCAAPRAPRLAVRGAARVAALGGEGYPVLDDRGSVPEKSVKTSFYCVCG